MQIKDALAETGRGDGTTSVSAHKKNCFEQRVQDNLDWSNPNLFFLIPSSLPLEFPMHVSSSIVKQN